MIPPILLGNKFEWFEAPLGWTTEIFEGASMAKGFLFLKILNVTSWHPMCLYANFSGCCSLAEQGGLRVFEIS